MAFSKVILNGTTLMDVTDTTAVAEDVLSGEYFYGADGVKTEGTGTGGGEETVVITINGSNLASVKYYPSSATVVYYPDEREPYTEITIPKNSLFVYGTNYSPTNIVGLTTEVKTLTSRANPCIWIAFYVGETDGSFNF